MKKFTIVCQNPKGKRMFYEPVKEEWVYQLTEPCLFKFKEAASLLQTKFRTLLPEGYQALNVLFIRFKVVKTKQDYLTKMLNFKEGDDDE